MTKQEAVDAVVRAWVVEGPSPLLHRHAKKRLKQMWPTLYSAVSALAEVSRKENTDDTKDDVQTPGMGQ